MHLEMGEAQEQLGRAPEFSMPGAEQKEFGKDWHSALAQLWRQTQCFVFAKLKSCRCGKPLLLSQNPTIKDYKGTLKEDGVAMHLLPSQIRPVQEPLEGDTFGEEHPTNDNPIQENQEQ